MPEVNTVTFDIEDYNNDYAAMDKDICTLVRILLRNHYELKIIEEDCMVVIIEYNYSPDLGYGTPELVWLDGEEAEDIYAARRAKALKNGEVGNDG